LISFFDPSEGSPDIHRLAQICVGQAIVPYKPFNPTSRKARLGLFNSVPRFVTDTFSIEMAAKIKEEVAKSKYDLVIASQFDMAVYREYFKAIPAIFEEVEIGIFYQQYKHAKNNLLKIRYGLTWWKHRNYLHKLLQEYHAVTVVSETEQRLLAQQVGSETHYRVMPNFIDTLEYPNKHQPPKPGRIIFTGSFSYQPNYDGMNWFSTHVLPILRKHLTPIEVIVTGDTKGKILPGAQEVQLLGYVEDIHTWLASAWLAIVPIFVGGGTRLKLLEAMAVGTPVVSTTKGAEGLTVRDGEHLLIADSPKDFSQAIIRLIEDQALRARLVTNARQLVDSEYSRKAIMPNFLSLMEQVVTGISRSS
jgi:glycosyltransferase involved in cell wall biosynthesis